MVLALGVFVLVVVAAGVVVVLVLAARQAREDTAPPSVPTDFVSPVSSGGYAWRRTDESLEQFQARIARDRDAGPPRP
jgi:hypothetical protein